jgi:hypothetical protein
MDIKNDVADGLYTIWEKAFQEIDEEHQQRAAKMNEKQVLQKYVVDTSIVWELMVLLLLQKPTFCFIAESKHHVAGKISYEKEAC